MFTCQDVQPTLFFGLKVDVHFCRRGHSRQLVVPESVYVLAYDSAEQLGEGGKQKESFEGEIKEYSRSQGRETLEMVVGGKGCFILKLNEKMDLRL